MTNVFKTVLDFSPTPQPKRYTFTWFADGFPRIFLVFTFGLMLLITTAASVQCAQSSPQYSIAAPSPERDLAALSSPGRSIMSEMSWYGVLKQALATTIGGLLTLVLLLRFVHNYQRESERQKLLHELAKEFEKIASTECVINLKENGLQPKIVYRFTVALTRQVPWRKPDTIRHDFSTSDRLIYFALEEEALVSASILHEVLFWFRRMHRARAVKLLSRGDLHQMWRQILPFITDGRYIFLKRYFGDKTTNKEDIEAILTVAQSVLRHCKKKKLTLPIDYLTDRADSGVSRVDLAFLEDIEADLALFIRKATQAVDPPVSSIHS